MMRSKRAVSILLSLAMLLGLAVTPVSAAVAHEDEDLPEISLTAGEALSAAFEGKYAKVGEPLVIVPEGGTDYSYEWSVGGAVVSDSNGNSYTPKAADLEKMIKVKVSSQDQSVEQSMYFSKLPVVYIDTEVPTGSITKGTYVDGTMRIQGSDALNTALYDGKIEIKGRGNSSWGQDKKPYKLKLDKKTGIFGAEKTKHWVLLANALDASLMRNTIGYNLAGDLGQAHTDTYWVDVILNGQYNGNYQLCEHVRVSGGVVDVFDWEDAASSAAETIADAEDFSTNDASELEDYMTEHMEWITTRVVTFKGKEYAVTDELPAPTGGVLMELSEEYDEKSKFQTKAQLPIMFNKPEYAGTNDTLFNYMKEYVQAFEDSVKSPDFYTPYQGQPTHYTELFDLDSLINYWIVGELFNNQDFMRKSTYFYKDIDGLAKMGPIWDLDYSSGGTGATTGPTDMWRSMYIINDNVTISSGCWYRWLFKDPYFAVKAQERYLEVRPTLLEDIIKSGGSIDQAQVYLKESGAANSTKWGGDFMSNSTNLKGWFTRRMAWLDEQFATESSILASMEYTPDTSLRLSVSDIQGNPLPTDTVSTSGAKASAVVEDERDMILSMDTEIETVKKAAVYVNGLFHGELDLSEGRAETTILAEELTAGPGKKDVVQVHMIAADGKKTGSNYISILEVENSGEEPQISIEGEVAIQGEATYDQMLNADLAKMTPVGAEVDYAWTREGEVVGTGRSYVLKADDIGKVILLTVSGKGNYTGSLTAASAKVEKGTQAIPAGITAIGETEARNDGKLTGVTTNMEYTLKSSEEWRDVNSDPITELVPGTYLIRFRETVTNRAGNALEVTILAYQAPEKLPKPQAKFDAFTMLLTNVTADMEYRLNDGEWMPVTLTEAEDGIDLSGAGLTGGSTIRVCQPGDDIDTSSSEEQIIELEQHPKSTTVGKTDKTTKSTGAITGVDDTMEYMRMPDGSWTSVELYATTVEVEPGTYQVRVKGAGSVLASEAVTVTIETAYTVTFETNGGSALLAATVRAGEKAARPTAPAKSGYTFGGWYSDTEFITKYDFDTVVTDDLILYAKWTEKSVSPPSSSGGGGGSGATTETEQNPDGSTTKTITDKKTGDVIRTTTYPDGTEIVATTSKGGNTSIEVSIPKDKDSVAVTIPTDKQPGPGEVAVMVKSDGSKEVVKTSVATAAGMRVILTESARLEIIDNLKTYQDVADKDWYAAPVQFVASRELMGGTSAQSFNPGAPMSRAMLMTTLARLDGQDTAKGEKWDSVGMAWAREKGISDGAQGEQSITREQLAAMLYRYAGSPPIDENRHSGGFMPYSAFPDADQTSGWAEDAMTWAVENGIISGGNGKLDPTATATRAEVAIMLLRFVDQLKSI